MTQRMLIGSLSLAILLILVSCSSPKPASAAGCEAFRPLEYSDCRLKPSKGCSDGFTAVISEDDSNNCICQCVDDDDGNGGNGGAEGGDGEPVTEVETAIGPISFDPTEFVPDLIRILISISGGIALVLMIFGSLQVVLSSGNPEKVKGGQEIITSAIMGLIFIIFSIFLLQFIGVKLFEIPGFGDG